ncbi:hypothetical protein LguiA_014993 [Lonicera macranthoides]
MVLPVLVADMGAQTNETMTPTKRNVTLWIRTHTTYEKGRITEQASPFIVI